MSGLTRYLSFLLQGTSTLLALCLAAYIMLVSSATAKTPTITDADILNFALNLEYLEANFYSFATTGKGIDSQYTGGGPPAIGGSQVPFTNFTVQSIALEIAKNELDHVIFLRSALGPAAVAQPAINVGDAFATAANAAFNTTLKAPFNPYLNDLFFLHGAFIFEDVGVTAYIGAAPLISNKDYLGAAAGILAVEAYHAGSIRTQLFQQSNVTVRAYGVKVETISGNISKLRGALGGGKDGNVVENGNAYIVPVDANSIAYGRTPAEVIAIVTAGQGKGLFFPNGLNGNIK